MYSKVYREELICPKKRVTVGSKRQSPLRALYTFTILPQPSIRYVIRIRVRGAVYRAIITYKHVVSSR